MYSFTHVKMVVIYSCKNGDFDKHGNVIHITFFYDIYIWVTDTFKTYFRIPFPHIKAKRPLSEIFNIAST